MVKIRLSRQGKKNDPFYRVVAISEEKKVKGKNLEILGFWHPKKDYKQIDKKKVQAWINKGAQLSQAVEKLLA